MADRTVSFRCRTCGFLEHPGAAGEHFVPHACRVCGAGVVFGTSVEEVFAHPDVQQHEHAKRHAAAPDREKPYRGQGGRLIVEQIGPVKVYKLLVPENWEVLHEADDKRLKELGVERKHVAQHVAKQTPADTRAPQHLGASALDGAGTTDGA